MFMCFLFVLFFFFQKFELVWKVLWAISCEEDMENRGKSDDDWSQLSLALVDQDLISTMFWASNASDAEDTVLVFHAGLVSCGWVRFGRVV